MQPSLSDIIDEHIALLAEARRERDQSIEHVMDLAEALSNEQAVNDDLLAALKGLFEHCAMVHKHWGEDSNSKQATAAQDAARAAIAKAEA